MSMQLLTKSQIFMAVIEVADELQRAKLICELCENDMELRREIEELVTQRQQTERVVDSPLPLQRNKAETIQTVVWAGSPTAISSNTKRFIGSYRLVQTIGAGGMDEAWVVEQSEPVKRQVAIKLIKGGTGSREILARFDIERQALALMNYANIARILDAATTAVYT